MLAGVLANAPENDMRPSRLKLATLLLLWPTAHRVSNANEGDDAKFVRAFLDAHCIRCHGEQEPKADFALHHLSVAAIEPFNLAPWQRVLEKLASHQMPPKAAKQPAAADRERVVAWIKATFTKSGLHEDSLATFSSVQGNLVDHDALFSGQPSGDCATPARVWRLSPQSYVAFMRRLNDEFQLGFVNREGFEIQPPWELPKQWDFADYSTTHSVGEAEIEFHLRNCLNLVERILPAVQKNQFAIRSIHTVYTAGKTATPQQIKAAVKESFERILKMSPEPREMEEFSELLSRSLHEFEPAKAVERFLISVLFHPEVFYRLEEPVAGSKRSIMPPRQLARAIAYTLTDQEPDAALLRAVADGKLSTQADVRRQVERILNATAPFGQDVVFTAAARAKIDAIHREYWNAQREMYRAQLRGQSREFIKSEAKVREMRKALTEKLKDTLAPAQVQQLVQLQESGFRSMEGERINLTAMLRPRVMRFFHAYFGYTTAPDVFKCAATRRELNVSNNFNLYWSAHEFVHDTDRLIDWVLESDKQVLRTLLTTRKTFVRSDWSYRNRRIRTASLVLPELGPFESFLQTYEISISPEDWRIGDEQPYDMPADHRLGILTHPSWLIAQSGNFDNHVIHRGRWIREKLLGGRIPDLPITVNAMLPDEPHNTLRERMRVTREEYCWNCHRRMDPLGLPFEQFDHFGRHRQAEIVVDKKATDQARSKDKNAPRVMTTKPFTTTGAIEDSRDPRLDGPVKDPFELIEKLAQSERVEQVFVRHVFRYFLGRNETLADGPTLVAAHNAYRNSDGSFKALLVSLLTSDSFLYRSRPTIAEASE